MSGSLLHSAHNTNYSGTSLASLSVTITSTTAGNRLKVWVNFGSTTTTDLSSISDNKSGGSSTYTIKTRVADTRASQSTASAYTSNIAAGITSVTMNMSPNTAFLSIIVEEWSGEDTGSDDGGTGQFQNPATTSTDAVTSTNVTTVGDGDTINGVSNDQIHIGSNQHVVGTGYSIAVDNKNTDGMLTESKIQSTHGAVAATYTDATNGGADSYVTIVMAFQAAAAAAGGGLLSIPLTFIIVGGT